MKQDLAVLEKGNYFVRAGVGDKGSDRARSLEVPVGNIALGVPGAGQTLMP